MCTNMRNNVTCGLCFPGLVDVPGNEACGSKFNACFPTSTIILVTCEHEWASEASHSDTIA